jgi:hypothetical protein
VAVDADVEADLDLHPKLHLDFLDHQAAKDGRDVPSQHGDF